MKGVMDTYPLHFPSNAEVKHAITALLVETRCGMNTEHVTACNMARRSEYVPIHIFMRGLL